MIVVAQPVAWSCHDAAVNQAVFVVPLWADLLAVALGAMQGALFASEFRGERNIDLLGVAVIGIMMGMGGGLIRDLLLNQLPAMLRSNWYLPVAIGASLVGMLLMAPLRRLSAVLTGLDALVIGLFGAFGTTKAQSLGVPLVPAVFVGVCSAVGGSVLRDILVGRPVTLLHVGTLYAIASASGCLALAVSRELGAPTATAAVIGIVVAAAIRLVSLIFGVSLPEQREVDLRRRRRD